MQLRNLVLLGTSILALAQVASAEGVYIDGGYATLSQDSTLISDHYEGPLDIDMGMLGGRIGYQFSPYFSVEGEALFGVRDDSTNLFGSEAESTDFEVSYNLNYLIGAYARGNLPLGDRFTAFTRVGLAASELDVSFDTEAFDSYSFTDEAIALGLGGEFDFTNQIYARGEYTRYEFANSGLDSIMASVGFRF